MTTNRTFSTRIDVVSDEPVEVGGADAVHRTLTSEIVVHTRLVDHRDERALDDND